ncbi:hypothetical protein [Nocardioides sp. YIM 152588]|uniref:hypothetical protein n=1 Tax=Nocardioides sp. YIM 152588 TaxID=3158259 RepID=UPI0032E42B48
MDPAIAAPPYDRFLRTAEAVARERAEVDPDLALEVFVEAATLIHNGLVLDGLDAHDADVVVAGLCEDLVATDPGAAIRARATPDGPGERVEPGAHDPEAVSRAYLLAAAVLRL